MANRGLFPGKPARLKRREVVKTAEQPIKGEKWTHIEKTRLFLSDFYESFGNSDEESDLEGFTTRELERSRQKMINIDTNINLFREDLSSAIEFHFEEKYKSILPPKVTMKGKPSTSDHLYNKQKSEPKTTGPNSKTVSKKSVTSTKPSSVTTFPRPRTPSHRKSLDSSKARTPSHRKSVDSASFANKTMNAAPQRRNSFLCEEALSKGLSTPPPPPKKPRVQILIPSWRPVDTSRCPNWRSLPGPYEDLSDQEYLRRHEKAEEEEQVLWEKWQTLREHPGGGRSKSRRWREVMLTDQQPSLPLDQLTDNRNNDVIIKPASRCRRISSLQSEDSFSSGRLSPRTSSLQEIMVGTAPPTPIPEDSSSSVTLDSYKPYLRSSNQHTVYYLPHHNQLENSFISSPGLQEGPTANDDSHSDLENSVINSLHSSNLSNGDESIMPLSPPLSPVRLSPHTQRKSGSSMATTNRFVECSSSLMLSGLMSESTSDFIRNSTPNLLMSPKSLRSVISTSDLLLTTSPARPSRTNRTPSKGTTPHKRSSTIGGSPVQASKNSRSTCLTPTKRPTTPCRESYPLRSQSPSRRTRQGSRR